MRRILLSIAILTIAAVASAQEAGLDYRRNSLGLVMVYHTEDEFGKDIYSAWDSLPFPDKFDEHNLPEARVIIADSVTGVLKKKNGLHKAKYGKTILTAAEVKANGKALERILNDAGVGTRMVARWFNLHGNGPEDAVFDTELIQQRGQYNASDVDVEKALLTARGVSMLSDAGEELIGQTFVLVNDMTYITAEERAEAAKQTMNVLGGIFDALTGGKTGKEMAETTAAIADSFTGFKVITNSYLFRLDWNDSIASIFYNDYYTSTPNAAKIEAFWADPTLFHLTYVAHEHEYAEKTELKGTYSRSEIVKTQCTRSIDKNIASLQLQYEDFKVKTPVYAVEYDEKGRLKGYSAKIGMKEGVSEKTTFQVVRRQQDPETGKTTYKYIATVKPVKGQIWDNRYNAVTEHDSGSELSYTLLKKVSGGEILPGMLIIEGKYKKVTE